MEEDEELVRLRQAAIGATPGSAASLAYKAKVRPKEWEYEVVALYSQDGFKMTNEEVRAAQRHRGRIEVQRLDPRQLIGGPTRAAYLIDLDPSLRRHYLELYDPEVMLMDPKRMVWRGWEARFIEGQQCRHIKQAWLIKLLGLG